jgi:phenylpyruvate tautomerase PptA (4-oxalocrotonate tautomerase family)
MIAGLIYIDNYDEVDMDNWGIGGQQVSELRKKPKP